MDKKTLYFDVETTGLDCAKHAIIQLACIIDFDGEPQHEKSWHIRPFKGDKVSNEALEVNGLTMDQLRDFPPAEEVFRELLKLFGSYVDKFDRSDKFYAAGFNVKFDMDFLKRFFEKNGDQYFGSWFNGKHIDPLPWLNMLDWSGKLSLPNYRLKTVCEHYAIELGDKAHDALADIRATRKLISRLKGMIV